MRKKGLRGLFLAGVVAAMFSGCGETSVVTISDAQEAKEALNTASSVCFKGDLEAVNQKTDILADGAIAGRMEESGFINTKDGHGGRRNVVLYEDCDGRAYQRRHG